MKKNPKKMALIGLAASVVFGTAGCGSPIGREADGVYGPPPPETTEVTTEITTEQNEVPAVYGPPEWFTEEENIPVTSEEDGKNEVTETTEEVTVGMNEMEDVYGPPVEDQ